MQKFEELDLRHHGYEEPVEGYQVTTEHSVETVGGRLDVYPGDMVLRDFPGAKEKGMVTVHRQEGWEDLQKEAKKLAKRTEVEENMEATEVAPEESTSERTTARASRGRTR